MKNRRILAAVLASLSFGTGISSRSSFAAKKNDKSVVKKKTNRTAKKLAQKLNCQKVKPQNNLLKFGLPIGGLAGAGLLTLGLGYAFRDKIFGDEKKSNPEPQKQTPPEITKPPASSQTEKPKEEPQKEPQKEGSDFLGQLREGKLVFELKVEYDLADDSNDGKTVKFITEDLGENRKKIIITFHFRGKEARSLYYTNIGSEQNIKNEFAKFGLKARRLSTSPKHKYLSFNSDDGKTIFCIMSKDSAAIDRRDKEILGSSGLFGGLNQDENFENLVVFGDISSAKGYMRDKIKRLFVSSGVKFFGEGDCGFENLEEVYIGGKDNIIPDYLFQKSKKLKEVHGDILSFGSFTFNGCESLNEEFKNRMIELYKSKNNGEAPRI